VIAPSHRHRVTRQLPWVALVVVVGVSLAIGASHPGSSPTAAQRAAAIDATLRCPSCEDISVADSSASTASAIRTAVAQRVRAGWSEARIDAYLVDRYGPGILLRPPARGATVWVWVLPPVGVVVAVGTVGLVLWRRRRTADPPPTAEDRALVEQALVGRVATRSEP
jgi:cytochrome c-type biogenesis protein CcmH